MQFQRKSYGAIFTDDKANIPVIKNIIKSMDLFEYGYLPDELIRVFDPAVHDRDEKEYLFLRLCYTGKFDALDLNELVLRCWKAGIRAWYMLGDEDQDFVQCAAK